MFHEFFHIPQDTSGHVGTARNVAGLYVVDVVEFPEWCSGPGRVAKVEVVSVLGFGCVLLPYSCSALHSYSRKRISFPVPNGDDGSALRGRFSLPLRPNSVELFIAKCRWWRAWRR